jgi:transcriptional antiterminator NusG
MNHWYALQCVSGRESVVRDGVQKIFTNYATFFPQRALEIRKNGKTSIQVKALFPGYFFLQSSSRLLYREAIELSRKINGICSSVSLLKVVGMHKNDKSIGSDEIAPILNHEMDLFLNITDDQEVVQFSQYKKEGDKVQIICGPLSGREGIIIKINPRKKRIKIGVNLLGEMQILDLGAEMIA